MPFVVSTAIFLSLTASRRVNIARMFAGCEYAGVVNIMKIYIRLTGGVPESNAARRVSVLRSVRNAAAYLASFLRARSRLLLYLVLTLQDLVSYLLR